MRSPKIKSKIFRPWLWPLRIVQSFTKPIPPGLWIVNFIFQRILGINNEVPWMVNFTACVVGDVSIGKNVWISFALNRGYYVQGGNGVIIGDNTIFASGVKIISANHDFDNLSSWKKGAPVTIGKNCWIGANSSILPEVNLGDNVIVGAGSVVTKTFPSNCIIAGNPAIKLKEI